MKQGSLGASFVSADWQVRVFWLSGIVDRPSNHLYIRNIPMSGCMDRRSCYTRLRELENHPKLSPSPEAIKEYEEIDRLLFKDI